jgi:hypothetical protein
MSEKRARVEDFKEAVVGQPLDTKLNTGLVRQLIEKLDVLSADDATSSTRPEGADKLPNPSRTTVR